jgi:hypothetical protein
VKIVKKNEASSNIHFGITKRDANACRQAKGDETM